MSDHESSASCSTCGESHPDNHDDDGSCCESDDTCLHESDLEWINESCDAKGHLFYLKALDDVNQEETEPKLELNAPPKIDANQRFRSSYTKLASWVFDNKRFGAKKTSLKRKNSRKAKNDVPNDKNAAPVINISLCDDTTVIKLIKHDTQPLNIFTDDDFVLMYLTPPCENNAVERDCLVFSYPTQDTDHTRNPILLKLKGMFITMSQVVCQITNQYPILSSISVTQNGNERIYCVGFIHEFSSMLALALPSERFTSLEVKVTIETISRMIRFTYNSLDAAFKNDSNHEHLQKICKIIRYILTKHDTNEFNINLFVNTIPRILIDDDLNLQINDSMSEYEAMDWLSDDGHDENNENDAENTLKPEFIVIGSCVLYKGHLIASHLPVNYLLDIIGFLRLRGLLALQSVKLVIWNEVHPVSLRRSESNDFVVNEGVKYFLAVIGIGHLLHCVLLEMPFISNDTNTIKPNELIVNESIKFIIIHLTKSGIVEELEHHIRLQNQTINSESDKLSRKRYKSLSSLRELIPVFSSSSSSKYHSTNSLLSIDQDSNVSDSHKSHSSPSLQHSILSQTSSSASICHSATGTASTFCCQNDCRFLQQNLSLPENLICYLDIENGLQITAGPLLLTTKEIRSDVSKKFFNCCFIISDQFKNFDNTNDNNDHEIGVTFEVKFSNDLKLKSKSQTEMVLFYVIGRIDSHKNEFYACFQLNNSSLDVDIDNLMYHLRLSRRLI